MSPGVSHVVIDTSFIGGGYFKARKFDKVVGRLRQRGHTVVVPEVVIWEWAEHAHRVLDVSAQGAAAASDKVDASLADRPAAVGPPHVNRIIDRLTSLIEPIDGAEIDEVNGPAAIDAVRDQVTQVGQGLRSREGTKTGAADGLVLATVLRRAAAAGSVVLCTGDRALGAAAADIEGVTVVRDLDALWKWNRLPAKHDDSFELSGEIPPLVDDSRAEMPYESVLAERMSLFIESTSNEEVARGDVPTLFEEGVAVRARVRASVGTWRDERQTDVRIRLVESVELSNLYVEFGDTHTEMDDELGDVEVDASVVDDFDLEDEYRLVTADAYVCALVDLTVWYVSELDGQLTDESATVEVEIEVPVAVEFDEHWEPAEFEANDVADVSRVTDPT